LNGPAIRQCDDRVNDGQRNEWFVADRLPEQLKKGWACRRMKQRTICLRNVHAVDVRPNNVPKKNNVVKANNRATGSCPETGLRNGEQRADDPGKHRAVPEEPPASFRGIKSPIQLPGRC